MPKTKILIVDDETNIRRSVSMILSSAGYAVDQAASAAEAERMLGEQIFDLMVLDILMPEIDGLQFLQTIKKHPNKPIVIMISGHATIENAVTATREGAHDFIEKPISKEKLLLSLKNALAQRRLAEENTRLRKEVGSRFEMIGDSLALQNIREQIQRVARANTRVLILGESGTGKELVARAIHEASERKKQPFIKVNCAAIPEELIESELFGHEKGAFTGATTSREGKFQQADQGTLFLDEVGDMSLKTQAKVLRVLQEGEIERVGGSKTYHVDVRVVAATNKNLEEEARQGNFREDLFFRLNVVPIVMPRLSERKDDIPLLTEHFTKMYCEENGFKLKIFSSDAIEKLCNHSWPGNIRELRNTIERLVIMTVNDKITAADLPLSYHSSQSQTARTFQPGLSLRDLRDQVERDYIQSCLDATDGNMSQTARLLGIERSHLYKKMRALGMDPV